MDVFAKTYVLPQVYMLQSQMKYLRQTLVLCEKTHCGKSSISSFNEFCASVDKSFILEGRLGYNSLKFIIFLIFPSFLRS